MVDNNIIIMMCHHISW